MQIKMKSAKRSVDRPLTFRFEHHRGPNNTDHLHTKKPHGLSTLTVDHQDKFVVVEAQCHSSPHF